MEEVKEQELFCPKRPDLGSLGQKIRVLTNFYEVRSTVKSDMFHYDVQVVPQMSAKAVKHVMVGFMESLRAGDDEAGKFAVSDGRANIFTTKEFAFKEKDFELDLGFEKKAIITLKLVNTIAMAKLEDYLQGNSQENIRENIQALDIATKYSPSLKLTSAGRGYFEGTNPKGIKGGAEVWLGYQQTLKPAGGRLLLNLDMAASAFIKPQPLLGFIEELLKKNIEEVLKTDPGFNRAQIKMIDMGIKKLTVEVTHGKKRSHKVNALVKETAKTCKFDSKDGSISVADYFKKQYNIQLNYPDLPLVHVGSKTKNIYLPIEMCTVTKGIRLGKLTGDQTADMIKITAMKPVERQNFIQKGISIMTDKNDPYLKAFGLEVSNKLIEVEARILPPPKIVYANDKQADPRQGSWQTKGVQFYKAAQITSWGFIVFDNPKFLNEQQIGEFVNVFGRTAMELGIQIKDKKPPIKYARGNQVAGIEQSIQEMVENIKKNTGKSPDLLVFVQGRENSAIYAEVKRVCDTVVDVPSQVILSNNIKKKNAMTCGNILMKVNVKLGGTNSVLRSSIKASYDPSFKFFMSRPAIIMGADVTHAGPGSRLPSIAAVVGSVDAFATKYAAVTRSQESRQEIIVDLAKCVKELLMDFYRASKLKPEKILFFRDGVGEGQFGIVLQHEVHAIKQACKELQADYSPAITFIVSQKRHHARFFPMDSKNADKSGNVVAGTVVDKGIVHPSEFDFYLVAHAGIQGTSRPCHYHVLHDESGFTADILQNFANSLCYTYARCTRSVSIVPPAYYAHIVAYRARCHARGDIYGDDKSESSGSSGDQIEFAPVGDRNKSVMYFM